MLFQDEGARAAPDSTSPSTVPSHGMSLRGSSHCSQASLQCCQMSPCRLQSLCVSHTVLKSEELLKVTVHQRHQRATLTRCSNYTPHLHVHAHMSMYCMSMDMTCTCTCTCRCICTCTCRYSCKYMDMGTCTIRYFVTRGGASVIVRNGTGFGYTPTFYKRVRYVNRFLVGHSLGAAKGFNSGEHRSGDRHHGHSPLGDGGHGPHVAGDP